MTDEEFNRLKTKYHTKNFRFKSEAQCESEEEWAYHREIKARGVKKAQETARLKKEKEEEQQRLLDQFRNKTDYTDNLVSEVMAEEPDLYKKALKNMLDIAVTGKPGDAIKAFYQFTQVSNIKAAFKAPKETKDLDEQEVDQSLKAANLEVKKVKPASEMTEEEIEQELKETEKGE